jgi:hypothetical protein
LLHAKRGADRWEDATYSLPSPAFLFLLIITGMIRFPPERTNKNDSEEKCTTDQYEAEYEQERHLDLQKNCCGDGHADLLLLVSKG